MNSTKTDNKNNPRKVSILEKESFTKLNSQFTYITYNSAKVKVG